MGKDTWKKIGKRGLFLLSPTGKKVSGLMTRVEGSQSGGDDTALNGCLWFAGSFIVDGAIDSESNNPILNPQWF